MKTYKTPDNRLYAFELDGSQDHLIGAEMVLITEDEAALIRAVSIAPTKITSITPRQIRQVLTAAGVRAQAEAAVAAGDQDLKDWWEFASSFERDHPVLISMATSLGLTEAQIDELFQQAALL